MAHVIPCRLIHSPNPMSARLHPRNGKACKGTVKESISPVISQIGDSFHMEDRKWVVGGTVSEHLTHWGWVMHICIGKQIIIGSDNGLVPGRRQAIIWTNAEILLILPLGTSFSEISKRNSYIFIQENAFENISKWHPFCLGLNVLTH